MDQQDLSAWVLGSIVCSGIDWRMHGHSAVEEALPTYRRVLAKGYYHLPLFLVLDLQLLLKWGFETPFHSEPGAATGLLAANADNEHVRALRRARLRYEREFLGRILQAPKIQDAIEIAKTSPNPLACVELLLMQLLRSFASHYPAGSKVNPSMLRDFNPTPEQVDRAIAAAAANEGKYGPAHWCSGLERFLVNLSEAVHWGGLLEEEYLFELTHLHLLKTEHLRMGCRQVLQLGRLLPPVQPGRLDLTSHEDGADTAFIDETHYPSGGLTGLTNRGSLESLLTSELVYLDEGAGPVSLFELRFLEGECLYFLRDSGLLRRKRRTIHFVIDAGAAFERKSLGYDWQYSVLIQGFSLRLLHDLFAIFEKDAVHFEFHYLCTDGAKEFLEGEIALMRAILDDYTKHGWVRLAIHESLSLVSLVDPLRKTYAIVIAGPDSADRWREEIATLGENKDIQVFCAMLHVDAPQPETQLCLPSTGLTMQEIGEVKDNLLERLLA